MHSLRLKISRLYFARLRAEIGIHRDFHVALMEVGCLMSGLVLLLEATSHGTNMSIPRDCYEPALITATPG